MIIASIILVDDIQVDGRHIVRERHIDDQNNYYEFDYVAEIDTDIKAKLDLRAAQLNEDIAAQVLI